MAPYITGAAILDTGSTDDTVEWLKAFFADAGIPYVVGHSTFKNFSQARNEALELAEGHPALPGEYLALVDADMELVVDAPSVFGKLKDPAYAMVQLAGTTSYWNPRLLRRDAGARYIGVTHEYLDIATSRLEGAWFRDHCSGSNRVNKLERDIKLLREDLERDRNNPRSYFYLAQSYKDAGDKQRALTAYVTRAGMPGWEEEGWYAQYQAGLLALPDTRGLMKAYNRRPWRAEPLYALANHHRNRGENGLAATFADIGLRLPYPVNDELFVDTYALSTGMKEELSIAGFYVPQYRDRGREACEELVLDRSVPEGVRALARANQFHYLAKLRELAPSYEEKRLMIPEEPGWTSMNPSITNWGDAFVVSIRQVNYRISPEGQYLAWNGSEFATGGDDYWQKNPIRTRNFIAYMFKDLALDYEPGTDFLRCEELLPELTDPPAYALVRGLEDVRVFARGGELWGHANIRELNAEGWCEQWLFRITYSDYHCRLILADLKLMHPAGRPREHQKNWMVRTGGFNDGAVASSARFVYRPGTLVNEDGHVWDVGRPVQDIDHFSGSSQLVPWVRGDTHGWLGVVHEAMPLPGSGRRYYQHRFLFFNADLQPVQMSRPFVFQDRQVEFAAGIAVMADKRVVVSFGVRDEEAWLATVTADDVGKLLA